MNTWFLPCPKRTKTKVNVIKIKTEVKLLSTELGKSREGKLKVKTRLFNNVKSHNV
jgi:hypothetical protein